MDKSDRTQVSRCMSHALRHEPWLYELELDDEGWTPITPLLAALASERPQWRSLTHNDLIALNEGASKRRFEIIGDRIRAIYGHSLPGKLKRAPATPPEILFHGTSPQVLPAIRSTGLLPMKRQYVHLSVDRETAAMVGGRKAKSPAILKVLAAKAHARQVQFYEGNDKVWLADCVPPEFIEFTISVDET